MTYQAHAKSTKQKYIVDLSNEAGHVWHVDEPVAKGGGDTAPNPMEVVLSALGACTTVTLQMYADHKGWDLQSVKVDLVLDPEEPKAGEARQIVRQVQVTGNLDEAQKERLLKVAESCPVHKLLAGEISIQTALQAL
ncbi:MAG TPA: OsmC family protein [Vitreoscilla sp.]|nr:OsmC family protein [Vitreoscilla sp.]